MKRFYRRNRPLYTGLFLLPFGIANIVELFRTPDWRYLLMGICLSIAALGMFILDRPYREWVARQEARRLANKPATNMFAVVMVLVVGLVLGIGILMIVIGNF